MDLLYQKSENLPADWITIYSGREYANYMSDIAIVMEISCRIIRMN